MSPKNEDQKKTGKAAGPAKKAEAQNPVDQESAKPAAPKKAAEAKPVTKKAEHKKAGSDKEEKSAKPASESSAPEAKESVTPVKKTPEPVKTEDTTVDPVIKPAVEAASKQEVKPVTQPLEGTTGKVESDQPEAAPKAHEGKTAKSNSASSKSTDTSPANPEQQSPTMRYSDAELVEFKELIMKKLDTAKKELNYLQGLITRKDESGDLDEGRYMTMEDGSMSMEREQLSQMASRQIQFIDHLEKAMMRIENKTYGVCRVTGKLIDKARLRAVPHATLSIEAKQMMNK